ncbi:hypothetical protein V6N11_041984 [Hibiscus sabdariffa]|uniref:Uncharacterized protein n=1 Tax=Hibiscus sabdariffa TaxID=183260 RepID=A0ABR2QV11_9ROSI
MVWTNEKHNLYLDFLEASFVKQLHYSTSLRACHPRREMWEPCPTPQLPAHSSSHQFSALQDGCYQKSNDPLLDSTADSSDIWESPLHRFTSADKSSSETFPLSRETVVPNGGTYLRSNTTLDGYTTGKFSLNLLANFLLPIAFIHFCYESPHSMLTGVYLCIALSHVHASFF